MTTPDNVVDLIEIIRPRLDTGIPADAQMYPPGCPDAEWCRGNRACYWDCKTDGVDE